MNRYQKNVVAAAGLLIAGMALYPPWVVEVVTREFGPAVVTGSGPYGPIFDPPGRMSPDRFTGCRVDVARLECQCLAVLAAAAVALVLAPSRPPSERFEERG